MEKLSKAEYTKMVMDLIYFKDKCERTWANIDLKVYDEFIYLMRYYRQFLND